MPAPQAQAIERVRKDHEARRTEATAEDVERRAASLGLRLQEVRALWKDGAAVVQRAMRAAVRSMPREILERAYPCSTCRTIKDDRHRQDCRLAGVPTCYTLARLRGCERHQPIPVQG